MSQTQVVVTAIEEVALLGLVLALVLLRKRSLRVQREHHVELPRGQRLRLMAMEWFEPVLVVVISAVVLWDELSDGVSHWVAVAIGAAVGIVIGLYRGRLIYVRAVPELKAVVLRRNPMEYAAVVLLLAINFFAEYTKQSTALLSLLVSGALGLLVVESIARVAWTTVRYRGEAAAAPATSTQALTP